MNRPGSVSLSNRSLVGLGGGPKGGGRLLGSKWATTVARWWWSGTTAHRQGVMEVGWWPESGAKAQ